MNSKFKIALAVVAGTALGAAAMQGLHAQAKPKAYGCQRDRSARCAAQAAYTPLSVTAQKAAGGRQFPPAGGKIVAIEGDGSKRVGISEWDSLEQAQAFYNSEAFKDLAPQRDKAVKTIRRYIVEAGELGSQCASAGKGRPAICKIWHQTTGEHR